MKRRKNERGPLSDEQKALADSVYPDVLRYVKATARRRRWVHVDGIESVVGHAVIEAARTFVPSGGSSPRTWAIRRAIGKMLDEFSVPTYKTPRPAVLPLYDYDPPAAGVVSADTVSSDGPENEGFERIVALAPARTREILRLVYRDGLTYGEAAVRLGFCHQTASNRKNEAFAAIRKNPKARRSA